MMKYLLLSLCIVLIARYTKGLACFTCIDASSNEECNKKGELKLCDLNQQSCQNEVRLSEGNRYRITKRCKQSMACTNNQDQNDKQAWDPVQCNPLFSNNSVCRCCCDEDLCNREAMPCDENPICPPAYIPSNGEVRCSNMNFVNSTCSYQCNAGYEMLGNGEINCLETTAGPAWQTIAPTCIQNTCTASGSTEPENGRISCSNSNKVGSSCRITCDPGFKIQGSSLLICELDGSWSSESPICIPVVCDPVPSQRLANGNALCADDNKYASVCLFSCDEGYFRMGDETMSCQQSGEWSNQIAKCERVTCDESNIQLENGFTDCTDGNFYLSRCSFVCEDGYRLMGPPDVTCEEDFNWSTPPASCELITCNEEVLQTFQDGVKQCTESNVYGSACTFECFPGYSMRGEDKVECEISGRWSNPPPICERETCEPETPKPVNGKSNCSEDNKSFSKCEFTCGDGSTDWELFGSNETKCTEDPFTGTFEWTEDAPCCAKRCPPFAQVDLFLVLDSSSSVGADNWNKTVHFVKSVIDNFVVSPDDMLVAAIRYNKAVDSVSEIKIGQYTDLESTGNAIINLPYDGSGTLTGKALTYVRENMLTDAGNRPDVQDLVLVVTDGISKDDIATPALELRRAKANVVALGVVNKVGSLKKDDIVDITGDPEKTVLLESGFEGLTDDLVDVILTQICGNSCDRQNQYASFVPV